MTRKLLNTVAGVTIIVGSSMMLAQPAVAAPAPSEEGGCTYELMVQGFWETCPNGGTFWNVQSFEFGCTYNYACR